MSTLVFLEHHGPVIQRGALGALAKAAQIDPEPVGVVIGSGVREAAAAAGRYGAKRVFVADDPALEAPLPQPRVDVLSSLVREQGFDTVIFAASVLSADVAGGVAARLGAGLNWDLADLQRDGDDLVGKRSALGDTVLVDVGWTSAPRLALIRSGAFDPAETGGEASIEEIPVQLEDFSTRAEMVEQAHEEQTGPSIEEADILVTGGRGLGTPEKFSILEELAAALGGAVASTRAVVDSGWYPYPTQVGQTGKVVSPKLYIGAGVSGAIQHKVGMQTAGTVVAINRDPDAPIAEYADLFVIGDLFEILPRLVAALRAPRR